MDEKRQRHAPNTAHHAARGRPGAAETHLRGEKPATADRPPKLGEILVAQGGAMTTLAVTSIMPDVNGAALQGQIAVSAYVPAQTIGKVVQQPAELTITDADIARGYVEVLVGSELRVTSNNPAGYVVDFFNRLPIFTSVRISSTDGSADLGPDGGAIIERGRHGRDIPLNLSYRFNLSASVGPGTYAWPLALNVRPL